MPLEQKGGRKGSYGCKEILLLNKVILNDVKKRKHNLNMAWIDYQKAIDSVPHDWLKSIDLQGLQNLIVYTINGLLIVNPSHVEITFSFFTCLDFWNINERKFFF